MILVGLAWYFFANAPRSTIPPYVQVQADFSRTQAAFYCAMAQRELRHAYWRDAGASLKQRQFKDAWRRLANGEGRIDGVVRDANGDVVACVTFRDHQGFWITVSTNRHQALLGPKGG